MKQAQQVFKAIADPSRRKVLKLLQRGSRSAGELAAAFAITKGSLSHHFNVLKDADLVRCERRGQQIVYSLNTTVCEDAAALLLDLFGVEAGEEKLDEGQPGQLNQRGPRGRRVRRDRRALPQTA